MLNCGIATFTATLFYFNLYFHIFNNSFSAVLDIFSTIALPKTKNKIKNNRNTHWFLLQNRFDSKRINFHNGRALTCVCPELTPLPDTYVHNVSVISPSRALSLLILVFEGGTELSREAKRGKVSLKTHH